MVTQLDYQRPSDAIRRALIRYYTSYTQVIAEYGPQLINDGIIPPAFTGTQLNDGLKAIGITRSHSVIFSTIRDPYNPVVAPVEPETLLANSTVYAPSTRSQSYYLRPRHTMLEMIETAAYFREYEGGYYKLIPPIEVFDDAISEEDYEFLMQIYEKTHWRPSRKGLTWVHKYKHFTDFSDSTRTPINNADVTKPSVFKVAFLDAVVPEGTHSNWAISKLTGIHIANIDNVLKKSRLTKNSKRIFVEAGSPWEAINKAGSSGYAVHLSNGTYMVQLLAEIREKTADELENLEFVAKSVRPPKPTYERRLVLMRRASFPGFQERFLIKSLRKIGKRAFNIEIPKEMGNISEIITYLREIERVI